RPGAEPPAAGSQRLPVHPPPPQPVAEEPQRSVVQEPPPTGTAPSIPAPNPEAPAATAESDDAAGPHAGRAAELARAAAELVAATDQLAEVYDSYLERKEDGGAELTPADEKLTEEIEALQESANRFHGRLKDGFFARTRSRMRREDP